MLVPLTGPVGLDLPCPFKRDCAVATTDSSKAPDAGNLSILLALKRTRVLPPDPSLSLLSI